MSDALPSIILVVVLLAIVGLVVWFFVARHRKAKADAQIVRICVDCYQPFRGVKAKRGWWWWFVPFGWWIIQKEFKCPDCKGKLILADSPKGRALMNMPDKASAASAP